MKKFNLFKEIIVANKSKLLSAINSQKEFAITIRGDVLLAPYSQEEIWIYKGAHHFAQSTSLSPKRSIELSTILGKNYQVVEDEDRVLIKAFSNWQEIIKLNTPNASYDDTTGDGVSQFKDSVLEDIGWNATEFNISYRTLVEVLESQCEGTLLCIEQEEPYQFSGLGFLNNNEDAQQKLFAYCKEHIAALMQNDDDYSEAKMTNDEQEAARFFTLVE